MGGLPAAGVPGPGCAPGWPVALLLAAPRSRPTRNTAVTTPTTPIAISNHPHQGNPPPPEVLAVVAVVGAAWVLVTLVVLLLTAVVLLLTDVVCPGEVTAVVFPGDVTVFVSVTVLLGAGWVDVSAVAALAVVVFCGASLFVTLLLTSPTAVDAACETFWATELTLLEPHAPTAHASAAPATSAAASLTTDVCGACLTSRLDSNRKPWAQSHGAVTARAR